MALIFTRLGFLAAILSLAACASSRSLDKSVTDLSANADLKGILLTDRNYDYADVDITIYEGRLLLTGTMRSEEGRKKLIENAWKADGVKEVIDETIVGDKTSFGQGFEDTRIDQTLRARLIAGRDVTSSDYKIAVSGAVVYLLGVARSQRELDEAVALARSIGGVEKVVSHVIVKNAVTAN